MPSKCDQVPAAPTDQLNQNLRVGGRARKSVVKALQEIPRYHATEEQALSYQPVVLLCRGFLDKLSSLRIPKVCSLDVWLGSNHRTLGVS